MQKGILNIKKVKNEYVSLLERKKEIEPHFIKLQNELDILNSQIAGLDQALRAAKVDTEKLRSKVAPKVRIERVQKEEPLPVWIYRLLEVVKKPMHYKEIAAHLLSDGFEIGGKDRANTVLAYIGRNKSKFVKAPEAGRGYYKIKE